MAKAHKKSKNYRPGDDARAKKRVIPDDPFALLTGPEVRYLIGGVSRTTLYRWLRSGRFPAPDRHLAGMRPTWLRRTIDAWGTQPRPTDADLSAC
ncbi:MAG: AlpA family phage regulatory protein [Acidobacteria bacterium]|nr:AlpA family phage regulatory protein [Acidobacteriota bacterium]